MHSSERADVKCTTPLHCGLRNERCDEKRYKVCPAKRRWPASVVELLGWKGERRPSQRSAQRPRGCALSPACGVAIRALARLSDAGSRAPCSTLFRDTGTDPRSRKSAAAGHQARKEAAPFGALATSSPTRRLFISRSRLGPGHRRPRRGTALALLLCGEPTNLEAPDARCRGFQGARSPQLRKSHKS